MSDVMAIFGILLFLGIVFPGMLTTWWLLFPKVVERAKIRLGHTPWKSFWFGVVLTICISIPIIILISLPYGPAQFAGWSLVVIVLGFASLGATGLAAWMGERISNNTDPGITPTTALLRGAIALELAAAFPFIGWFILIPLATITSIGTTAFAMLRWMPEEKEHRQSVRTPTPIQPQDIPSEAETELRGATHDALSS